MPFPSNKSSSRFNLGSEIFNNCTHLDKILMSKWKNKSQSKMISWLTDFDRLDARKLRMHFPSNKSSSRFNSRPEVFHKCTHMDKLLMSNGRITPNPKRLVGSQTLAASPSDNSISSLPYSFNRRRKNFSQFYIFLIISFTFCLHVSHFAWPTLFQIYCNKSA